MKSTSKFKFLILTFYILTFVVPFILLITKCSFTFFTYIECLKEFSIPMWVSFFSISWLYYKKIIKDREHLTHSVIEQNEAPVNIEEIKKRNAANSLKIIQRENAERSIKTLEFAIAIAGIIIGVLGIVSFLYKSFFATTDN